MPLSVRRARVSHSGHKFLEYLNNVLDVKQMRKLCRRVRTPCAQPEHLLYFLCKYTGKYSLMLTRYVPNYDEMKFNFVDLETLVC